MHSRHTRSEVKECEDRNMPKGVWQVILIFFPSLTHHKRFQVVNKETLFLHVVPSHRIHGHRRVIKCKRCNSLLHPIEVQQQFHVLQHSHRLIRNNNSSILLSKVSHIQFRQVDLGIISFRKYKGLRGSLKRTSSR